VHCSRYKEAPREGLAGEIDGKAGPLAPPKLTGARGIFSTAALYVQPLHAVSFSLLHAQLRRPAAIAVVLVAVCKPGLRIKVVGVQLIVVLELVLAQLIAQALIAVELEILRNVVLLAKEMDHVVGICRAP
jgi:hypothetical protein